jgi:hypothetical protein
MIEKVGWSLCVASKVLCCGFSEQSSTKYESYLVLSIGVILDIIKIGIFNSGLYIQKTFQPVQALHSSLFTHTHINMQKKVERETSYCVYVRRVEELRS